MKKILFLSAFIFSILVVNAQKDSTAKQDTTLKEYTGRYTFPSGSVVTEVTIMLDGNALTMTSSAGSSDLTKLGVDSFNVVAFQGIAAFKRDSNNKLIGVIVDAMGYHLEGTKEPATPTSFILQKEKPSEIKRAQFVVR